MPSRRATVLATRRVIPSAAVALVMAVGPPANAEPSQAVTFRAGRADADTPSGDVTLQDNVEVAFGRYRLRGTYLHLHFANGSVAFDGDAHLALCPCPSPPLTFAAVRGRLDPAGDVHLRFPRVEIGGFPLLALPYLWLRTPEQVALLPPLVAVRGANGLLVGSGAHFPWRGSDGSLRALDLVAGGYLRGGVELEATLATPDAHVRLLADIIEGTRLAVEARGALVDGAHASVAWDLDAVRGDRARSGTIDLAVATRPFDTAMAQASLRGTGIADGLIVAAGGIGRAFRGDGKISAGPRAFAATGGSLGGIGSWSADAGFAILGGEESGVARTLGRASLGGEIDARPGPFELRTSLVTRGRMAGTGGHEDASGEAVAATRIDVDLPLTRSFGGLAGRGSWTHWITPSISLRGAFTEQQGAFFLPMGSALPQASWIAAAGGSTSLSRIEGPAVRLEARVGGFGDTARTGLVFHSRLNFDAWAAGLSAESAAVREGKAPPPPPGTTAGAPQLSVDGVAVLARARLGPTSGIFLRFDVGAQAGTAAGKARGIAGGAWAAVPGDDLAYFATPGATGGMELSIPWTITLRTVARADADLTSGSILALRALAEYRHPCGCFGMGLLASQRLGRQGADVALSIDVASRSR